MLYQKICFVGLITYATLSRALGATYYAQTTNPQACSLATIADTCEFVCDRQDWKGDFDCGNAGICNIKCEQKQCFMGSTITANNCLQLNVQSPIIQEEKKCYHKATFHLPNAGNATLSAAANSLVMFTEMVVNAGPNTRNIWIDCGSAGICNKMTINAQTAQFLSINLDGSTLTGPVDIYCPQNVITDNYKPYEAPCYINAWNKATLHDVNINTLLGTPHDVYINVDDPTNWESISLTCSGIDNAVSVDGTYILDQTNNQCWNTRAPTLSPTLAPTFKPTQTPIPTSPPTFKPTSNPTTNAPTFNPTISTVNPSLASTHGPTTIPTSSPTNNPTEQPTISPSVHPSYPPSKAPTQYPTAMPSESPTDTPSLVPSVSPTYNPSFSTEEPSFSPTQYPTTPSPTFTAFLPTQQQTISPNVTQYTTMEVASYHMSSARAKVLGVDVFTLVVVGVAGIICTVICCFCCCVWRHHKLGNHRYTIGIPSPEIRPRIDLQRYPPNEQRMMIKLRSKSEDQCVNIAPYEEEKDQDDDVMFSVGRIESSSEEDDHDTNGEDELRLEDDDIIAYMETVETSIGKDGHVIVDPKPVGRPPGRPGEFSPYKNSVASVQTAKSYKPIVHKNSRDDEDNEEPSVNKVGTHGNSVDKMADALTPDVDTPLSEDCGPIFIGVFDNSAQDTPKEQISNLILKNTVGNDADDADKQ